MNSNRKDKAGRAPNGAASQHNMLFPAASIRRFERLKGSAARRYLSKKPMALIFMTVTVNNMWITLVLGVP